MTSRPGPPTAAGASSTFSGNPWPALWAVVIGFFMILVDTTIVTVAIPALMTAFDADINLVIWVSSAYLLAYAVPLLITGRLGDRIGPKGCYLAGLTLFTLASLWCGLTGSIHGLIIARVAQGLGASLMTPQTMTIITRTFPANARGQAMGLWGAVAGVATLVGPIVGGILIDAFGWQWIFFINIPVGVIGFVAALRLVPALPTHAHAFDWVGVALSAVGMFALVFGIQEGQTYAWGAMWNLGPVTITVPEFIGSGLLVLVGFVLWQRRVRREPLVPLSLFRDRNFSVANVAMFTVGFSVTSFPFAFMIWAQVVRGFPPTQAALLMAPSAILSGILAPTVGRLADTYHPRNIASVGITAFASAMILLAVMASPTTPLWQILAATTLMGIGHGFMWAPISSTATRNLRMDQAGAGSGVYNTTRQVGGVLGSAAIAVMMEARLAAHLGSDAASSGVAPAPGTRLPPGIADAFGNALGESMLLPAALAVVGLIAVMFFVRPTQLRPLGSRNAPSLGD